MRLIDSHCHFDDPAFDPDRMQLQQKMAESGVTDIIFPATIAAHWPRLKAITDKHPGFHASYGLHPMFMQYHKNSHINLLHDWLDKEPTVAIGECGLDFFIQGFDQQSQEALFLQHLRLAHEFDLPLIIHARKSLDIVLKHIRRTGPLRGVIHSFAGSQQQADQLINAGFYLGIGGTITYERAKRLQKVVRHIPENHLLLETDAPDQPDSLWRGKRNEPGRLPLIANAIATIRETSIEHIAAITTQNARELFALR